MLTHFIDGPHPEPNSTIVLYYFCNDFPSVPVVNSLVQHFRLEQNLTEVLIDQLERTAAIERDEKIKFVCVNYSKNKLFTFLNNISANFEVIKSK